MRAFAYERPARLADALALLADPGAGARLLAGGTDLIIRIRDGSIQPTIVVDVKGVAELERGIVDAGDHLTIGARTVMTDLLRDERIRRDLPGARGRRGGRRVGPDPEPGDARRATSATPRRPPTPRRPCSCSALGSSPQDRARAGPSRSTSSSCAPASRPSSPASWSARSSCRPRPCHGGRCTSGGRVGAGTTSRR